MKNELKAIIKGYFTTLIFFAIIGLVGGFFVGLYLLDSYPEEIRVSLAEEMHAMGIGGFKAETFLAIVTAIQSMIYGAFLGFFGIFFAKRAGLWKDERSISKKPLALTLFLGFIGGLILILPDVFIFGKYSEVLANQFATPPTVPYIIATVTYGAVIEEVMLRLFAMSLVAFILHKLFGKKEEKPKESILIISNIVSAFIFALGHLPTTVILIGSTPLIIFRCILLNGTFGLVFGYLYRKYGLRYAMIAHGSCHVVSKLIWLIWL